MKIKQLFPFVLIATISLVYSSSLGNGFVWLDQAEILNKKLIISDWSAFIQMFFVDDGNYAGYHRPMYNIMHSTDHMIWKENAFGYHLSSLILHLVNVILIFKILLDLSGKRYVAFGSSLLFGLLPCHTATVSLIHSKADLLATLFILLAIFTISKIDFDKNKKTAWLKVFIVCFFFLLAILSKEVAIMLPFLAFAIGYLFYLKKKTIPKPYPIYFMTIVGVLFLIFRLSTGNDLSNPDALSFIDRILSFIPVYTNYIMLTLSGIELTTNDAVLIWNHIGSVKYLIYVLIFLVIIRAQYFFAKKNIFIAAGFLWYNVFLIPVAQIIPILHFRADRFMYIPSIGFIYALVFIFFHYYEKRKWNKYKIPLISIFCIYLLLCSYKIWDRNKDFDSDEVLFGELIKAHPECREAQGFVGNVYLKKDNNEKALIHINNALNSKKGYYSFVDKKSNLGNLGVIYLNQNKLKDALDIFKKIKLQEGFNPEVLFNLGLCYKKLKNYNEAKLQFEDYLEHKPNNIDALFNLGQIGIELNDRNVIQKYFGKYLELNPNSIHKKSIEDLLRF